MTISAIFTSITSTLDILSGIETNSVLAERIALLKDQIEILRYTQETTQKELTQLKEQCSQQQEELTRYRAAEQFVFKFGAAFKKTAKGYIATPYCPNCLLAVGTEKLLFSFKCARCGWCSLFKGTQIEQILKSLP